MHVSVSKQLHTKGLDGIFRIHLPPESLIRAKLKLGDVCEIASDEDADRGAVIGYAIAWPGDDHLGANAINRPAKISETLSTILDLRHGAKITVKSTTVKIFHAEKITLSNVTANTATKPEDLYDGRWLNRVRTLFNTCDALAPGMTFEVQGKKKDHRLRFAIDSIESADAPSNRVLFYFDDQTQLISPTGVDWHSQPKLLEAATLESLTTKGNAAPAKIFSPLETNQIGGLEKQIEKINSRIRRVLTAPMEDVQSRSVDNDHIFLHGYEGTGKSMLLDSITRTGFRSVLRLKPADILAGGVAKSVSMIASIFERARANQPSLIVMDDIDQWAPADGIAYTSILVDEFAQIRGTQVLVVAASRSTANVRDTLFAPEAFLIVLELPVPDITTRERILRKLLQSPISSTSQGPPPYQDDVSAHIAARTHGYTNRDVQRVYLLARGSARDRLERTDDHFHSNADILPLDWDEALNEVRPTALREIFYEKPTTTWDDIGGSARIRETCDRALGWSLNYRHLIGHLGWQPPMGVLLYGPPGCSKTLTARAVANMYNLNFIAVKGAELISMYVGESERAVREIFRKARAAAPCVIFFDEFDSIGGGRDHPSSSSSNKDLNVVTTLLNEMDGFDRLTDVYILAATNRPDTLDSALLRPGRFDVHIYLGPPDAAARREILRIATRGIPLAPDVAFDALVRDTDGYSGAELVRICMNAREPAVVRLVEAEKAQGHPLTVPHDDHAGGPHNPLPPTLNATDSCVRAADFAAALDTVPRAITQDMLAAYELFEKRSQRGGE